MIYVSMRCSFLSIFFSSSSLYLSRDCSLLLNVLLQNILLDASDLLCFHRVPELQSTDDRKEEKNTLKLSIVCFINHLNSLWHHHPKHASTSFTNSFVCRFLSLHWIAFPFMQNALNATQYRKNRPTPYVKLHQENTNLHAFKWL